MIRRNGATLLLAMLAMGCRQETVGDAISKLRDDSYVKVLETRNHRLELRFIPETLYYLTFGSLDSNSRFTRQLVDSVKSRGYLGYGLMFTLTLAPRVDSLPPTDFRNDVVYGGITETENYRDVLEKFQNGLSARIWLEVDGKRKELRSHHMTNSWGMTKSRVFTLLFDPVQDVLPKKKGRVSLVIEDLVPGQGREKIQWHLPISRFDFI